MKSNQLLQGVKESISPKNRRLLKRMMGHKNVSADTIILKNEKWVEEKAKKYYTMFIRDTGRKIESNINEQKHFPTISYSKDFFIEKCLRSGFYTFEDMLVIRNPYGLAPLTALAVFETEFPCRVQFVVKGDRHVDNVSGLTCYTKYHRVPILGLYPGRTNQVLLRLVNEQGYEICRKYIKLKTKQLPQNMRDMVHVEKQTVDSANTLTFVYGGDTLYPYAFDSAGDIRYYIERTPKAYGLFPLENGKFLFSDKNILKPSFHNPHATNILEMDFLGRVFRILNVEKGLHHDGCEIPPDGNYLVATSSLKGANEDAIVEINRRTGKVIKQVELGNLFDDTYKTRADWAHINTVSYNPADNTVMLSLRNLHAIVKIDWWTGEIIWIFANPEFFKGTNVEDKVLTPVGEDMRWFFQQHAGYMLEEDLDGNPNTKQMIVFDNHWHRRRPVPYFDEDTASYVRIYSINEKDRTVSIFREYKGHKSKIRSNGILKYDKKRVFSMSGYLEPPMGKYDGIIYEYDYDTAEVLNEYHTVNSFYRAYDIWADYEELSKSMKVNDDYVIGELEHMRPVRKPDITNSKRIPEMNTVSMKKEKQRKRIRKEIRLQNYDPEKDIINVEEQLAKIKFMRREDIVYLRMRDHFLDSMYLIGKEHYYKIDFTNTVQEIPALFGKSEYYVAIPLESILDDAYMIYVEKDGQMYNTEKYIHIFRKGNALSR